MGNLAYACLWEHPGLYDVLWQRGNPGGGENDWKDFWPALVERMQRAQPAECWQWAQLRPLAEKVLRRWDAYRSLLVQLDVKVSQGDAEGFASPAACREAQGLKSSLISQMGELRE